MSNASNSNLFFALDPFCDYDQTYTSSDYSLRYPFQISIQYCPRLRCTHGEVFEWVLFLILSLFLTSPSILSEVPSVLKSFFDIAFSYDTICHSNFFCYNIHHGRASAPHSWEWFSIFYTLLTRGSNLCLHSRCAGRWLRWSWRRFRLFQVIYTHSIPTILLQAPSCQPETEFQRLLSQPVGIVTYVQAYLFNKQPYAPNPMDLLHRKLNKIMVLLRAALQVPRRGTCTSTHLQFLWMVLSHAKIQLDTSGLMM